MTTEKQFAANRANSLHSTGPQSPAGKAAVSQNRTVHGLNYNAATFTVLPSENQAEYNNLLEDLQAEHKAQTPTEELLVVSMAQHRWLLDRATRLQETCFNPETGEIDDVKRFSLYLRYATTHERAFHKCLATLLTQLSQLNGFSDDFGGFPSDKSIHCNNSLSKTVAVKTYPLSL